MRGALFALAAVLGCASCGAPASDPAPAAASPAAASPGESAPAGSPAREFAAIDGCALISGDELVQLAGAGRLASAPTTIPGGCMYVIEMSDGAAESYQYRYDGSGMDAAMIEHFEPADAMKPVEGPWDAGRIGPQPLGGGTRFVAVRGNTGLEVTGDRPEILVGLARLAAARAP